MGDATSLASNKSTNTNVARDQLLRKLQSTADEFIDQHGGATQSHDADSLSVSLPEGDGTNKGA